MKKLLLFLLFIILLSVVVTAKCGDGFCDPDEDCAKCKTDCLCKDDKCCADLDCQECETSICESDKCVLERMDWVLQDIKCYSKGIISFKLDSHISRYYQNNIHLKDTFVYSKLNDKDEIFSKINGKWYYEGEEILKEKDYSLQDKKIDFKAEEGLNKNGEYVIRVKSKLGRRHNYFVEGNVECTDIKEKVEEVIEIEEEPIIEEPEIEEKEPEKKEMVTEESETKESEKEGFFKRIINFIISFFS